MACVDVAAISPERCAKGTIEFMFSLESGFLLIALQLERKRHLGNDLVVVIFREPGKEAFDVSQIHSQFNCVFIVVTPHGMKRVL